MKRKRTEHPLDVAIREMAEACMDSGKTQVSAFGVDKYPELLVEIRVGVKASKPAPSAIKVYDRFGREVQQ